MIQRANVARPAAANQYHQTAGVKAGPEALLSGGILALPRSGCALNPGASNGRHDAYHLRW